MNLRNNTSLSMAILFSFGALANAANRAGTDRVPEDVKTQALVNYGKLPLSFEENRGQTDSLVKFLSQGSDYSILLAPSEVFLNLQSTGKARRQSSIRMSFPGANSSPAMAGGEKQSAVTSYFIGRDPAKWVAGAPNFARVRYHELYPGVDLAFYGNQGQLEYDFVVAPGANPAAIRLQFDGVDGMRVDPAGNLVLSAAGGEIRQHRPSVYQEGAGGRQVVEGRYVIQSRNQVEFEIAGYDHGKPLVIDPTLTFATYLGSPGDELYSISAAASTANYPAVAVDLQGNVYVAGYNGGTPFAGKPVTPLSPSPGNGDDVFVVKMNPTGTSLLYTVFFGGTGADVAGGIALDAAGNAYITGSTTSNNFPLVNPAQPTFYGNLSDPSTFVTEVNAAGTALVYSTYLGGSGSFSGRGIAVDHSGNAYVTGTAAQSGSTPLCTVCSLSSTPSPGFLTEVSAGGGTFAYSTYLPAGIGYSIALDSTANAYITGATAPTPAPFQGYVLKVNAGGASVGYGPVLLGNSGAALQTVGFGIALDVENNAYVTGMTTDPSFPQVTPGAPQSAYGGGLTDGFVVKLNNSGGLVYGTYLGGLGSSYIPERGSGIGVDAAGNAYVSGTTQCIGFPTASPISGARNGASTVLAEGTISGTSSTWSSTGLAGSFDQVTALAFDSVGNLYAGASASNAKGGGVYKRASGSSTWAPTGPLTNSSDVVTTTTVDAVGVDPINSSYAYAAGSGNIYQSANGGTSWTQLFPKVGTSAVIAVGKTSPSTTTVYVGSSSGLIYSTGGPTGAGSSWNSPATTPGPGAVNALAVDPVNPSTVYAGTAAGVYLTTNGGVNWNAVNTGLPFLGETAMPVTSVAIYAAPAPATSETIYAATGNGVFYSTNAGGNWTGPLTLAPETDGTPFLLAIDANDNVYLSFYGSGIVTGTSGGLAPSDWSAPTSATGLTQNQILALAGLPTGAGGYAGIVSATTAFLTKISPNGQSFLSSTCIGGSDNNLGQNIAVTPGGTVLVSGATFALNFPATPGAVQTANAVIPGHTTVIDAFAVGVLGASSGTGGAPTVVEQSPVSGALLYGAVTVTGYALDSFSGGTAISSVQVWLDGSYVTTATYGISNPSACTPYPTAPGCPNVGFTYEFNTSSVTPGSHTLDFYALDSSTPANIGTATFQFTALTSALPPPYVFGSGPGPDVIWEEPKIGWAQVWYLNCVPGTPCYPPVGAANLTEANPWNLVGVGDFNGDGAPDVVWQNPNSGGTFGAVQVWYLGGAGGTTLISAADITTKNPWRVASVADFNRDGHPDLLWQDPVNGFSQIWYMGGPEGTTLLGAANLELTNPWNIVGTGDFNGDGVPDVLWQDPVSGTVQIWYMGGTTPGAQGTQLLSAVNLTGPMTTKVVAIADFNHDGHPDVVFQDPITGAATIYYYTGAMGTTPNGTSVLSTGNPWYIAGPH